MDDLELCKAFGELEGLTVSLIGNVECVENLCFRDDDGRYMPYNPIADLSLNSAACDKYEVETSYDEDQYSVGIWGGGSWCTVKCKLKSELPRVRIECILKSKGLI